ncbi:hypothetical protein B0J14DRAFT_50180 [Halenospora varia]|nr:hypothetical protein B0J14DRAFT_50180 [Halenospora varia]
MKYTNNSIALISVSVVLPVVAALFVLLRLYARRSRGAKIGADDYWILVALFISVTGSIPYIVGACLGGIGQHIKDIDWPTATVGGKMLFAFQFFYLFAVAAVKVSVIYFYRRVFTSSNTFRKVTNGMLIFVLLWTIAFFFATVFQAWPVSWNWTGVGKPIQYNIMYYATCATEIAADLVILCLPIPMIKSLHLSKTRRWTVMGIFGLGGFCVIAAVVRLYYQVQISSPAQVTDPTYQTIYILIWSSVEPCASIICACLPILGPLFIKIDSTEAMVQSGRIELELGSRTRGSGSEETTPKVGNTTSIQAT